MGLRIITGERSKSCVVVVVGAILYLIETAFEQCAASTVQGLGVFLGMHTAVLVAKCALVARRAATDDNISKLSRGVMLGTLVTGLVAVCFIYGSGKAFETEWRAYANALVIGGLSAIFHLVPHEVFRARPETSGVRPSE